MKRGKKMQLHEFVIVLKDDVSFWTKHRDETNNDYFKKHYTGMIEGLNEAITQAERIIEKESE